MDLSLSLSLSEKSKDLFKKSIHKGKRDQFNAAAEIQNNCETRSLAKYVADIILRLVVRLYNFQFVFTMVRNITAFP